MKIYYLQEGGQQKSTAKGWYTVGRAVFSENVSLKNKVPTNPLFIYSTTKVGDQLEKIAT